MTIIYFKNDFVINLIYNRVQYYPYFVIILLFKHWSPFERLLSTVINTVPRERAFGCFWELVNRSICRLKSGNLIGPFHPKWW